MNEDKRYYRKKLSTNGLLYLLGEELDIEIKNISVTGMLVKLINPETVNSIADLFAAINQQAVLDIYVDRMALACEVAVVRADMDENEISLAVEFRKVSSRPENALYKRQFYRKNMLEPGLIVLGNKIYPFESINASTDGLMVRVTEKVDVKQGVTAVFRYDSLKLNGQINVVWVSSQDDGSVIMGLQYVDIDKSNITGIPRF